VCAEFGGSGAQPGVVDAPYLLTSAVNRPQITTLGREAYPTFSDKAAALVFALLQSRPFRSGNRRVALATLLAFVDLNNRSLDSRIFDEKAAETILKRAASCREQGVPPENAFRELRETLGRSIV
jgi:prophage maintenance system killer protein